jgi:hypothetical protein
VQQGEQSRLLDSICLANQDDQTLDARQTTLAVKATEQDAKRMRLAVKAAAKQLYRSHLDPSDKEQPF